MNKSFYIGNRQRFAASMRPDSIAVLFAGREIRKTHDEYYPFFAQRNFVYLTGIQQKNSVLVICKDSDAIISQRLYILPGDAMAERWTGRRLTSAEAEDISVMPSKPLKLLHLIWSSAWMLASTTRNGGLASGWRTTAWLRKKAVKICLLPLSEQLPILNRSCENNYEQDFDNFYCRRCSSRRYG